MAMVRPSTRRCVTVSASVGAVTCLITVGFDPKTGQVFEVFYDGGKEGSALSQSMKVVASLVSRSLQRGDSLDNIIDGTPGLLPFAPNGIARITDESTGVDEEIGEVYSLPHLLLKVAKALQEQFSLELKGA